MTGPYDDIIDRPRPVSKKHPPMPMTKRAAQFLPFAALTGFEGEIAEAARLTEPVPELGEDALVALDEQLALLRQRLSEQPEITLTRFIPDESGAAFMSGSFHIVNLLSAFWTNLRAML